MAERKKSRLSLRKNAAAPVVVHQNVRLVPARPVEHDEEGPLPEILPPTPVIDLITEDEASEVERTPRRSIMSPTITSRWAPQQDLDHRAIEEDAAAEAAAEAAEVATEVEIPAAEEEFIPPPPLMRLRTGKNLAMLRRIAEAVPPASPTPSQVSEASTEVGPEPNVLHLIDQQRRRHERIEEERRRLERGKRKLRDLAPEIRERLERNDDEISALERHIASLRETLQERLMRRGQLSLELRSIEDFCQ